MRANSSRISWFSALSRSGRFIRTTRICPWVSVSTTAMAFPLDLTRMMGWPGDIGQGAFPKPRFLF
jgi:hypothetical protein